MKTFSLHIRSAVKAAVPVALIAVASIVSSCGGGDDPLPPEPPEPPKPPVEKTDTFRIAVNAPSDISMTAIRHQSETEKKFIDISALKNIRSTAHDIEMFGELLDFINAAGTGKIRMAWNGKFVYAATDNIVLTNARAKILARLPFGIDAAGGGYRFVINTADENLFNSAQLAFLRFANASLIEIAHAAEFGAKLREAESRADAGEKLEVKFTGKIDLADADSLILLRKLWKLGIIVVEGDGELNAVVRRHPTEPAVISSLDGLTGKLNAATLTLAEGEDIIGSDGKPFENPLAGKPAIVMNDTVARLVRTLVTQGRPKGTYLADVRDPRGQLTDIIAGVYWG
ncbi:MAG: hypothetical protein LBT76_01335, partial [Tannerella sp.]|nr:hypothetical protein [Tannerella sp.]